jgi:HAE1 family hydrophobic/amphiphilic exporter-1
VKKALAFPLLVISIKSPNGTYDSSFLSNYTTINVNDAIARIPGVGRSTCSAAATTRCASGCGPTSSWTARPDRPGHRQRHRPAEPVDAAGQIGGPPASKHRNTYTVRTQGRLLNEEEFGNIVVGPTPADRRCC